MYGNRPIECGYHDIHLPEYMHYMYLPICMDGDWSDINVPKPLIATFPLIEDAMSNAWSLSKRYKYVYLTARRGFASPDNPLNRPGWHTDGFGTDDLNFTWCDKYPTRVAVQLFNNISEDHNESIQQFTDQVLPRSIEHVRTKVLYRMDPFVVHATPLIPAPGGERQFIKVSFSNSKYNLEGNSHNYMFDYNWKMYTREEVRNNPIYANSDSVDL